MVEVMGANEDLAKGVFRKLSGQDDVKVEEVVKEEGKEDVLAETKGGGKVEEKDEEGGLGETNKEGEAKDSNNESKIKDTSKEANPDLANKANEGLHQTEEEMVASQSDEGKTEDDWVQLVQKQSDLFEAF